MAKFNATDLRVEVDGNTVAHATSANLNLESDMIDASSKDSQGWAEFLYGQRNWTIETEQLVDYSATFGVEGMFDAHNNRTTVTVKFTTSKTGDLEFSGSALVNSTSIEAPLEDVASGSATFQGTAALSKATIA